MVEAANTIEHIELGKSGLNVPRLCLGGWQAHGWTSSNDKRFIETIQTGIERGLTFIDTAEGYGEGHSEMLIGRAIKGKRDRVTIASKFSHTHSAPRAIRQALERSLKRLGTDYLDLYQQHWPPKSPPLQETIDELLLLKKEGKIRAVGVSNYSEIEFAELQDVSQIDTLQPCYSLLWRQIESRVLPLCRNANFGVLVYSPLCQGLLSGRFMGGKSVPHDSRRHNLQFSLSMAGQVQTFLQSLERMASRYGKSTAQLALRWVLQRDGIHVAIVGSSTPAQVEENIGALGWHLEGDDFELLERLSAPFSAGLGPHSSLWNWHPRER